MYGKFSVCLGSMDSVAGRSCCFTVAFFVDRVCSCSKHHDSFSPWQATATCRQLETKRLRPFNANSSRLADVMRQEVLAANNLLKPMLLEMCQKASDTGSNHEVDCKADCTADTLQKLVHHLLIHVQVFQHSQTYLSITKHIQI